MAQGELPKRLLDRLRETLEGGDDSNTMVESAVKYAMRTSEKIEDNEAFGLMVCCLIETAKLDLSPDDFHGQLRSSGINEGQCNTIVAVYKKYKMDLRKALLRIGWHPPHVIGVDWKLDYRIKGNLQGAISRPAYVVSLKVQECDTPIPKDLVFSCTVEEMQNMVWKLKEATKTVQLAANQALSNQ